jgi:hypothetical protein
MNKGRSNDHMAQGRTAQGGEKRKAVYELSENSVRISQQGENQENLERHGLHMAAQYARFIFVREGLVGNSMLSLLSL